MKRKTCKARDIHWADPVLFSGLNITKNKTLFIGIDFTTWSSRTLEILAKCELPNNNKWNATEDYKLFRDVDTGYLGVYCVYPGGYGTYTYDPNIGYSLYDTTDLDYIIRYVLDSNFKNTDQVQQLIADLEVEKMLTKEE